MYLWHGTLLMSLSVPPAGSSTDIGAASNVVFAISARVPEIAGKYVAGDRGVECGLDRY